MGLVANHGRGIYTNKIAKYMLLHRYEGLYGNGCKAIGGIYKARVGCSWSLLRVFASKFSEL